MAALPERTTGRCLSRLARTVCLPSNHQPQRNERTYHRYAELLDSNLGHKNESCHNNDERAAKASERMSE